MKFLKLNTILFLLTVGIFLSSCRENDNGRVVRVDYEELTVEQQAHLGYELSLAIAEDSVNFYILDEEVYEPIFIYTNLLLSNVINTSLVENRTIFDWEVIILKGDERKSSFSTPGGKIYIYTGMLKFLQTEHELASLLAHEIYLIEQGITSDALIDEFTGDLIGRVILGHDEPEIPQITQWLRDYTYAQEDVLEADNFTVDLICPFQYDVTGIKSILQRSQESIPMPLWVEHRPGDVEPRIQRVSQKAATCKEDGANFADRYQGIIGKLP